MANATSSTSSLEWVYGSHSQSEPVELDIIAVHGLGRHMRGAWTSNEAREEEECMWLRDILPSSVPRVRIHAFSYAPTENNNATGILNGDALTGVAEALLREVASMRKGSANVDAPISFLAHDIGGIIVKKALLIAESHRTYHGIAEECHRLIFFGTPQRTSVLSSSWEDLLLNIILDSPESERPLSPNVVPRLGKLSSFVEHVSTRFAFSSKRHLINVFQQGERASQYNLVIDRFSATTGLVHEINLAREVNHGDLCHFSGAEPSLSTLSRFLEAETNQSYRLCLSGLSNVSSPFTLPDAELELYVREPDTKKYSEFSTWINGPPSRIIATSGQEGIGKSLTARALFRELQKSLSCAAYFCFGETDACRVSATELLASTILQWLTQAPARYLNIEGIHQAMATSQSGWTHAGLLSMFHSILDTAEGHNPLYLIIDNLDRCDSSWNTLLSVLLTVFRNNRQQTKLKVAVFCQERQDIQAALDGFEEFRLFGPVLARESPVIPLSVDLADCVVNNNPSLLPLKDQISATLDKCRDLSELPLTLHSIQNSTAIPSSHGSVRTLISTLPAPMQDEVSSRFNRLQAWGRAAVGWVCHAKRPLSLTELTTAVALTNHKANFVASFKPENLALNPAAEVESAFGGLVRCRDGGLVFTTDSIRDRILELIVQDQRLRLARHTGQAEPKYLSATLRHSNDIVIPDDESITAILVKYLSWTAISGPVKLALTEGPYIRPPGPLFELAPYAMKFWPHHYRNAAVDHPQVLDMLLPRLDGIATLSSTRPFLLAAQLGLTDIVKTLNELLGAPASDYEKAFRLAIHGGHEDTVDYLLDLHISSIEDTIDINNSAHGYEKVVKRMLEHAEATNILDQLHLDTLLCRAAQLGYESQVKLFLELGADVNGTTDGATPLQHAAGNGRASIVCYLLEECGADVDSRSGAETDSPILLAVAKGYELVVEHLLHFHANTKPNIDEKDSKDRSPLMIACMEGHQDIAKLLLEHGAHVDTGLDIDGHSTIYYAVRSELGESLLKAMLDRVSSIDRVVDIGDVFVEAVKVGFTGIVNHLLSWDPAIKVDDVELVSRRDKDLGRTALHHAAEHGHTHIVFLLLDALRKVGKNVQVDAKDDLEDTPLALAAVAGKAPIVELLLERNANPRLTMSGDRTVINMMASSESPCVEGLVEVMKLLLERHVDPNTKDTSGRAPIHWAAARGHVDIIRVLLGQKGIVVNAIGRWGWNALHFAANSGRRSARRVAELLIHAGTDPLLVERDGWIPIHLASRADNTDTGLLQLLWEQDQNSLKRRANDGRTALHFGSERHVALQWLIEHGADVNAADNRGQTALMTAATTSTDTGESIRVLLENGADPMRVDDYRNTALLRAAHHGGRRAAEELLRFGEDTETLLSYKDPDNCSALHVAILHSKPEFAEMLLDSFYATATGTTLEDLSAKRESNGNTPLISAVTLKRRGVIKRLLALGAEPEIRNNNGDTALLVLVGIANSGRDIGALLRLLLDPGPQATSCANVNAGSGTHPTALHEAALQGNLELVEDLVWDFGADVNAVGGRYHTALTAAAYEGHTDIVAFLLEHKAALELHGGSLPYTFHPLQAAVFSGSIELVSKLLEAGADVNSHDIQGRTALHIAALLGSLKMVSLLARNDFDMCRKDKQGRTLLHHGVLYQSRELIDVLLSRDSASEGELNVPDANGWTPLHWACRVDDNEEVVESLLNAGKDDDILLATPDGWTPENICAFHHSGTTKTFVDERVKRIRDTLGAETGDSSTSEPAKQDEHRHWKVGYTHMFCCDGCFIRPLVGVQWICKECRDFRFCFKCFWTAKETHPGHEFEMDEEVAYDTVREPELADGPNDGTRS